jgi:hypothetical protein
MAFLCAASIEGLAAIGTRWAVRGDVKCKVTYQWCVLLENCPFGMIVIFAAWLDWRVRMRVQAILSSSTQALKWPEVCCGKELLVEVGGEDRCRRK